MKSNSNRSPFDGPEIARKPAHGEIAARAETLWRQMGCPEYRDEEIWLEAERQLRASDQRESSEDGPEERMEELEDLYPDAGSGKETTSL